jgi:hypothetical protein
MLTLAGRLGGAGQAQKAELWYRRAADTGNSQAMSVGWHLIIPMIIQTILLDPSRAIWIDEASKVSSPDPSGAVESTPSVRLVIGRSIAHPLCFATWKSADRFSAATP